MWEVKQGSEKSAVIFNLNSWFCVLLFFKITTTTIALSLKHLEESNKLTTWIFITGVLFSDCEMNSWTAMMTTRILLQRVQVKDIKKNMTARQANSHCRPQKRSCWWWWWWWRRIRVLMDLVPTRLWLFSVHGQCDRLGTSVEPFETSMATLD